MQPDQIPEIPFTQNELKRAKKLEQFLELEPSILADGRPNTMENFYHFLRPTLAVNRGEERVLHDTNSYRSEPFFNEDQISSLRWVLQTKDLIVREKNALEETEALAKYATEQVFVGQDFPDDLQEALQELTAQKEEIRALMEEGWGDAEKAKIAARRIANLKINEMFRRTPREVIFDANLQFFHTGKRHLPGFYDRTRRISSSGKKLVLVGRCGAYGASVCDENASMTRLNWGVSFRRSR